MFIRTCHQSSWLQLDRFLGGVPKFTPRAVKQGAILYAVPVAGTEAAIRGDGWQASLPRGSSDDRLLLDMYPIRGCKDSKKLPTHRVVRLVPLQHLRQLRTLRTTWIVHVVRNLLRALDCKFIEPINELGIAANAWRPGVSSFLSRGRTADLSPRNPRASHFMRNQ
jgi:hypothetical protein